MNSANNVQLIYRCKECKYHFKEGLNLQFAMTYLLPAMALLLLVLALSILWR